jgi:hypothetical protein
MKSAGCRLPELAQARNGLKTHDLDAWSLNSAGCRLPELAKARN